MICRQFRESVRESTLVVVGIGVRLRLVIREVMSSKGLCDMLTKLVLLLCCCCSF